MAFTDGFFFDVGTFPGLGLGEGAFDDAIDSLVDDKKNSYGCDGDDLNATRVTLSILCHESLVTAPMAQSLIPESDKRNEISANNSLS